MSIRKTVVSGSFYPDNKKELLEYFEKFNKIEDDRNSFKKIYSIIVPHAGYIYSGFTANKAYKMASLNKYKRVIVVGPSHKLWFSGASVCLYSEYETPFGNLKIDLEYSNKLIKEFDFLGFEDECSFEHSTEVQAPFVKYYFGNIDFVEIVYGDIDYLNLEKVFEYILKNSENLLIISSDLSHFYSQKDAMKLDLNCLTAISNKDLASLEACEACGKTGIKSIIDYSIKNSLKTKLLHYCTSADISNDFSRVVGYTSALIGE
ncbi:AmmeMemoRadiSam system protein B [Aliarcobacter trophiarum LMG 25534]|uniref:AmmeMemoRadiSam system protein B n=1 Tax=Aliarcobacter trophiarum LMG 25534 TaxID=1032241 RepID=A0AAD0QJE2_9BACT|nr:AmmeMemoRadiSam system protein B [Aliarcobacter trophiarum]AXK48516.1 AmmeMemoRadiSam system protein B [Aliarcobacter trophiarum LMG 25534]RXI27608.1 AmmeMemoRadiSam system protein B [Aliarcobacter trophiarum]RXJ89359.1 AmmeMemoRadiSam system protein B [Aliarcobacter trophiarum LMG 25534]